MAGPFAAVPEAILQEILLRLPSWASFLRAALASKHWYGIISKPAFLVRYRKLHPSSPLLGFFFSDRPFGLPAFRLASAVRSDPDLRAVQRGADLLLANLTEDSGWRIRDSRNGHLLLCQAAESGGDSFSVYNPVSRRLVTIPDRPHDRVGYFADCLLDLDSFRVVSVQQHRRRIRAVEYDPGARQWRSHGWQSPWAFERPKKLKPLCLKPMQAAGRIFWIYSAALALVLDCSSMQFSTCPVPIPGSCYAIGEIKDNMGCLVSLDDPTNLSTHGVLKVWLLNTSAGTITWELTTKTITVMELLGPDTRVCQVVLVSNGLALISMDDRYDQFVIHLNDLSLHAKFDFHGRAYPYQMEWPPARLPALQEEAQLVLPVVPATPLRDVDAAAPIDDVGLALDHVGLTSPIDDVAYTEEPSTVVSRPLEEHVIFAEAGNLAGTVEDGVRLMETMAAASSTDLAEGMAHSSPTPVDPHANLEALSTQQPKTALDEHLHEEASESPNRFCIKCPGECHKSTCPQHGALLTKPICEGVVSNFRVDPPLVPAPCFPPMSVASNNHSPTQFFGGATYTQKVKSEAAYTRRMKNSEEPPDMESDEPDHTHAPVDENQNLNQGHESLTAVQSVSTLADTGGPPAVAQPERRNRKESKCYPSHDWDQDMAPYGVVSSFRVDPALLPAPCFPPMCAASNNHSPMQFFDGATYTQKVKSEAMYTRRMKNSEEPPDMESDEPDHTHAPVDENQNLNQGHESFTAVQSVSTPADTGGPPAVTQRERRNRQESKRYPCSDWVLGRKDKKDAVGKG